jgi:periplasmic divalent cation tolerance protein
MIICYITCKDDSEAERISKALIEKKLIACANYFPIKSLYRWKEELAREKEVVLLAKSLQKNFAAIQKEVRALHSYEVPCILKLNVEANNEYEDWVKGQLK